MQHLSSARQSLWVRSSYLAWILWCALTGLVAASCVEERAAEQGQLIVAVQSDMSFPKDIDSVRAQVRIDGKLHTDEIYSIAPDGDTELPITLTLLESDSERSPVEITVVGSRGGEPRVFGRAVTQVPEGRTGLLQLPLQWLCDGSAVQVGKGRFESTCADPDDTCRLGECADPDVPVDSLPDFDPEALFGGGEAPDAAEAQCFDTALCFDHAISLVPDEDCVVEVIVNAGVPALGLSLPQPGDGICGEAGCYIPLDQSEAFGFYVIEELDSRGSEMARVQLPPRICELLDDGSIAALTASTVCSAKTPRMPTCGLWSAVDRRIEVVLPPQAAEPDAGGLVDAGTPPSLTSDAGFDAAAPAEGNPTAIGDAGSEGVVEEDETITLVFSRNDLARLVVIPERNAVPVGVETALQATGVFEDGSSEDVSAFVTWSSDDPEVVSVAADGVATTLGVGATQVRAELDGVTGLASFEVSAAVAVSLGVGPANVTLPAGHSVQLQAAATFSDGSTVDVTSSATWSSDDTDIANVDPQGRVTTSMPGQALVTASYAGLQASSTVVASDAVLLGLSITPPELTRPVGVGASFLALATFSDGTSVDVSAEAEWAVDEPTVASIDATGQVTTLGVGSTIVTASFDGEVASALLDVTSAELLSVEVTPATDMVDVGSTRAFSASGTYSDGTTLDLSNTAVWTTDDHLVATVSSAGLVTGVSEGTTVVRASSGGVSGAANLEVTPAVLERLTLSPSASTVVAGGSLQFTAYGYYSDDSQRDLSSQVVWSSQSPSIASIGGTGLALGIAPGATRIDASVDGLTASASLTVTAAELLALDISPQSVQLPAGSSQALVVTAEFSDGSYADVSAQVQWSSDNPSVVGVSPAGVASALTKGQTTVRASLDSLEAAASITVTDALLESISVEPAQGSVAAGLTLQFTAEGKYSDDSTLDLTSQVIWQSSNPALANVALGLVKGLGVGNVTLSATLGSVQGSAALTVTSAEIVGLSIEPSAVLLDFDETTQLTAVATFTDGSSKAIEASWEVADATIAKLEAPGLLRGVGEGETKVRAKANGFEAEALVGVNPIPIVDVKLSPTSTVLQVGQSAKFTATAYYADGSPLDVTNLGTWTAGSKIIELPTKGTVHAVAEGSTTVGFAYATFSLSARVDVKGFALQGLRVDPTNVQMLVGSSRQLQAYAVLVDGTERNWTSRSTWSSSVRSLAVQQGLVTAIGATTGSIKASYGDFGATADVVAVYQVELRASPNPVALTTDSKVQLNVVHVAANGSQKDVTSQCKFVVAAPQIVRVTTSGVVVSTPEAGTTTIRVEFDNLSLNLPVTVTKPNG